MVTIEGTASLNLVKEQLDESLKVAESQLEQFVEDPAGDSRLRASIDELVQVKGVLKLIELHGAAMLVEELVDLATNVLNHRHRDNDQALGILSGSLMVLNKYLEYVHLQQQSLPVLLVPVINDIRSFLRKPLLPESSFFELPTAAHAYAPPQTAAANTDELLRQARRLRHLYQVGMLGVFKGDNVGTHSRMMLRALTRLEAMAGAVPFARTLWLGRGLTESLAEGQLAPTTPRKSLLGLLDRQIKTLVTQGAGALQRDPPPAFVKEAVFAVSLASVPGVVATEIVSAFGLPGQRLRDEWLQSQREIMFGPGGSVMRSVVEAIREELTFVKEQLDLGARGAQEDDDGFVRIADSLHRIGNTLIMLGQDEVGKQLKDKAEVVAGWHGVSAIDGESDDFQAVADTLLFVENSVSMLLPRVSGTLDAANDEMQDLRQRGMSLSHVEEARRLVVNEARAGLSLAKRAISSFMESNWDSMHLANVPTTLKSVWGGLVFLQMNRAAEVLRCCEGFIGSRLIRDRDMAPDIHTMETLADAITSVDYYLESMEDNKPIGDSILDVAEESVKELGFPVKAA